jgi:hypothetical protein
MLRAFLSTISGWLLFNSFCLLPVLVAAAPSPRAAVIAPLAAQSPATAVTLYFLNSPEAVQKPGTLTDMSLPGKKCRVFFHYINCTSHPQHFMLTVSMPMSSAKLGWGVSGDPGTAGCIAATQFLKASASAKEQKIAVSVHLDEGVTISGIIEGDPGREARLVCRMGDITHNTVWRVASMPLAEAVYSVAVEPGIAKVVRIGQKQSGHIDGDYGVTYTVQIKNSMATALRVSLVVSPRGGGMRVAYRLAGTVHQTPHLKAYGSYEVASMLISPGQTLEFNTIPEGGFSYPLELLVACAK